MGLIGTLAIFFVFLAVLGSWDTNIAVQVILSAMFAALFAFIIFRPGTRNKPNEE